MLLSAVLRFAAAAAKLRLFAPRARRNRPSGSDRPLKALFLSAYPEGHYGTVSRLSSWIAPLKGQGIEVTLGTPATAAEYDAFGRGDPEADRRYLAAARGNRVRQIRSAAEFDVVYLHRGVFPFGPWQRPTFERILARVNSAVVYDFYDSIWVGRQRAAAGARGRIGRWLNPPDLVESIAGTARTVTVSNEYLAAFAREHHGNVRLLPMVIDPGNRPPREHRQGEKVTLGWMGSAANLAKLAAIAPALRAAAARVPIRLKVVSSAPFAIEGIEVESLTHPWSPESERGDLAAIDVGLLPLLDTPIDRGKSPYKLVQYASAGLPIVATSFAVDPTCFPDGEAVILADSEEEWIEGIVRLASDAGLRTMLGETAQKAVRERCSFDAHAASFATLLRETAAGGRG
jgi:glycosyltransferase involved in cell wall biosynthesis